MNNHVFMSGGPQDYQLKGHFTHSDNLVLPLKDTQGSGEYHIPINQGIGPLLKRNLNEPLPHWSLIPYHLGSFRPRRVLPDGTSDPLRTSCWIYLFRNGYLWREIRTPEDERYTQLFDVNLDAWHGQDQRLATCPGSEKITIPYRINHLSPEYRLIFSEIQLTWTQLEALGGLHPDDPRNPDATDQQTPETLEHLAQRSSRLTLTDNLGQVQIESLLGPDQPDYPASDLPGAQAYLHIADPLQDARDLKAVHNEQLSLLAHCIESRQQGPIALAQLIENLTANGDPNQLLKHLDANRYDQQLLQAIRDLEDQLPDRILAAEMALLNHLQTHEQALQTAFSDYLTENLDHQEIGLNHLNLLISDLASPASLDWLYTQLNNPVETNTLWHAAQGNNETLLQRLRQRANGELPPILANHPLLQSQQNNDPQHLATLTSSLLISLIENHDLALGHHHQQDSAALMTLVANRFQKLSGIAVRIVQETRLGDWLPDAIQPQSNRGYRYLPTTLIQQIRNLGSRTLPQILPEGHASLRSFLQWLDATRAGNASMTALFGPLLLRNAWYATSEAMKHDSIEKDLNAAASGSAFIKFIADRVQRAYPELHMKNSSHALMQAQVPTKKSLFHTIKLVGMTAVNIIFKLISRIAIAAETALSSWHFLRGYRTGNTGVMATSALILITGLLAISASITGPFFWVVLLIGLGAVLLREHFEYNALEAALRFGWLGATPYPKDDACPFEAPALPNWKSNQALYLEALQRLAQGNKLYGHHREALVTLPDLSAERDVITQALFAFTARMQVLQLSEYHATRRGRRARAVQTPNNVLIELEVSLTQFMPLDSLLDGFLEIGSRRIALNQAWIHEHQSSPDAAPNRVTFYLPTSLYEATFQASAQLWLHPDAQSGQQPVSYNLPQPKQPRTVYRIFQDDWNQIMQQARYVPQQHDPQSLTRRTLAEDWQNTGLACLFNTTLQGAT